MIRAYIAGDRARKDAHAFYISFNFEFESQSLKSRVPEILILFSGSLGKTAANAQKLPVAFN